MTLSGTAEPTRREGMSDTIPDFGDWGNGIGDWEDGAPVTPDDQMQRIYFSFNHGTATYWGTARVPPTWTKKRIREKGIFFGAKDLCISRDILSLRHFVNLDASHRKGKADG